MLYLIHGEDTVAARRRLDEVLAKKTATRIDGRKLDLANFELLTNSSDMFSDKKIIVIENFPTDKSLTNLLKIIHTKKDIDVVLYKEEGVDKRMLEKIKADAVYSFPFPKYFYQFLDGLAPKKGKVLHELLSKMSDSYTAEQVLYSMIKRVRLLLALTVDSGEDMKEVASLASWQEGKIRSQARFWTQDKIISFYKKLYEIETGLKTSGLAMPLKNHLDILLLTELQ